MAGALLLAGCSQSSSDSATAAVTATSSATSPAASQPALSTAPAPAPETSLTDPQGFQYRVQAGPAAFVVSRPDTAGPDQIAPPGSDFIAIPITVINAQSDRPAPMIFDYHLFVAATAADTYGRVTRDVPGSTTGLGGPPRSNLGAEVDCSKEQVPAPPQPGQCSAELAGVVVGDAVSGNEMAAGGNVSFTLYSEYQVPATANLAALTLYTGATVVLRGHD
jgi:hypothetical protein